MSRSNRNHNRRTFRFEQLEAKTSPTSFMGVGVDWIEPATAEVASATQQQSQRFLQYVSMLEEVSIERALPTQAEADVVDQLLSTDSP